MIKASRFSRRKFSAVILKSYSGVKKNSTKKVRDKSIAI